MKHYDYNEVIEYIEKKHGINTRDYANSHNHFPTWLKLMNEETPIYPISPNNIYKVKINDDLVKISKEEYDKRFKIIDDQYKRYNKWRETNPKPPYWDFWCWLVNNDFLGISNGCNATLNVKYWLDELDEDDWQREILQLIHDEYKKDEMDFWIEW